MSPQEAQMLQNFLNQLVQATNVQKDPEAQALIANAVARQPDAAYLLVQRAMLMEQALDAAKTQISSLQNQLQASHPSNRGFLDAANTWGNHPAPAPRQVAAPAPAYPGSQPYPSAPGYQAPPQYSAPAASGSPGLFGGRAGSFLGSAAATAAGVAGGAFLFQGIENLLGHHGGSGFMNPQQAASLGEPVENTTINNYYSDDGARGGNDQDTFSSGQNDLVSDDSSSYSPDPVSDDDSFI